MDSQYFRPSSSYLNKFTWLAPYYRSFTGVRTIFYRETNESSLLQQVSNDIKRKLYTNFYATNLFLITYISSDTKFQATLATDGKQTITVLNYEELPFDPAGNVEMNERGCGYRVFFPRFNSVRKLINGNETGVRGRHIFNLTKPGCFRTVSGLRVFREGTILANNVFSRKSEAVLPILKRNEQGDILFNLKEGVVASINPNPIILTVLTIGTQSPTDYISRYAVFNPGKLNSYLRINNLFVLKNTGKSSSFQYGDLNFGQVESQTKCREIFFNKQMISTPAIKISTSGGEGELRNYVNVWLKNVSSTGFTACVKEMIAFSGKRDVNLNFIAATADSEMIQEVTHFNYESTEDDLSDRCIEKNFQKDYISTPYVFTSIETVGNGYLKEDPAIVWINRLSSTKVTVCVRSSRKGKFRIHLITKGEVSPCTNFSCPDHLECQLTLKTTPFCGCIKNCAKYNDSKDFCGSDFNNYESVCLMNKDHCQRFGNESKSNVTIHHYGKCQGMFGMSFFFTFLKTSLSCQQSNKI